MPRRPPPPSAPLPAALGALALAACGAGKDTGGPPPLTTTDDTAPACPGGEAPVITEVRAVNTGIADDEVGDLYPTLTFEADVTDADGDLGRYQIDLYYDDAVDGAVVADPERLFTKSKTEDGDELCEQTAFTARTLVFVTGTRLDFDTAYEWGLVITDMQRLSSEMAVLAAATPREDGEDGTGGRR